MSAHEIGRRLGVSRSAVLEALQEFGLNGIGHQNGAKKLKGEIPFGYMFVDCKLQKCSEEHAVIRPIRQLRANGRTLRAVADELDRRLVATNNQACGRRPP